MRNVGDVEAGGGRRRRSLQHEWSRAFVVMLVLLVLLAAVSIVGVRSLFDGVQGATLRLPGEPGSLTVLRADLADLERMVLAALSGLFALGLTVTVYVRHRIARDFLRPVATMYECVQKIRAGDYNSRVEVSREDKLDELGEVAQAFNGMAEAIHSSHLAVTLRATFDPLTGLANRATLTERLTASFRSGSERRARQESLLYIDIDDFKQVNETKSHEGGDAMLIQLATRLTGCVRPQDLVARLGGDEFAILVAEDDDSSSVAVEVADRVLDALREPFIVSGDFVTATVSIGVAQRRAETTDAAELFRQADFAMYMAKGGGKARLHLFDATMHEHLVKRSALKTSLAGAVASGELRLEYQPVADLHTGEILGVEALVRWQHPTLGLLSPETFIPVAEQTGDIDAIGCWVLDTATRQVAAWRQTMEHCNELWVSVNLSALQLVNPTSLAAIKHILADPATQADRVVLEVAESALAADLPGGIASLTVLKELGVRVAIDDFGTGFSSISTLAELPVDVLKVDGSFIAALASAGASEVVLEGIFGLAKSLSLEVIAEGIEEPHQLNLVRKLGCRMGQGHLLAWPASTHVLEAILATGGLLRLGPSAEVGGTGL